MITTLLAGAHVQRKILVSVLLLQLIDMSIIQRAWDYSVTISVTPKKVVGISVILGAFYLVWRHVERWRINTKEQEREGEGEGEAEGEAEAEAEAEGEGEGGRGGEGQGGGMDKDKEKCQLKMMNRLFFKEQVSPIYITRLPSSVLSIC